MAFGELEEEDEEEEETKKKVFFFSLRNTNSSLKGSRARLGKISPQRAKLRLVNKIEIVFGIG